ncbi:MAG: hypothetical protein MJ209_06135 [archaeon]|nr:hypothetical protein [archaeon]
MDAVEVIAVIILILAILVLVYYYLQNNPEQAQKIRTIVPDAADSPMEKILHVDEDEDEISIEEDEEGKSMTKKIKVKLSDIDFNTDGFSKKIDAFLDEKSDQLIKDWDLATNQDLSTLEDKFTKTVKSVDDLQAQFKKFQSETDERFDSIEKRIEALEED